MIFLNLTNSRDAHLGTWIGDCVITVGVLGEGMLIETAVQIIENEKKIFQLKNHVWIIREVELLEQIR